jgi:pyruvate kinase
VDGKIQGWCNIFLGIFRTGRLLARCRPPCPIIAVTRNPRSAPQMHLNYGLFPLLYKGEFFSERQFEFFRIVPSDDRDTDWPTDVDNRINYGIEVAKSRGFVKSGDFVVVVTGWRQGKIFERFF